MTNPYGVVSLASGAPDGLAYCGHAEGFVPNVIGDAPDPDVTGDNGLVFYMRPSPGEILVDGGPDCSPTPMNAVGLSGALYPYTPLGQASHQTHSSSSSLAAGIAGGAACEFVTVEAVTNVDLGAGYVSCTRTADTFSLDGFDVAMSGFGSLQYTDGTPHAAMLPPLSVVLPSVTSDCLLLRPTPLTWPGQDPDNVALNRQIFHPAEVAAITWTMTAYTNTYSVGVHWHVNGYQRQTYPTPCPIIPGATTEAIPSTIAAGARSAGLIAVENILGTDRLSLRGVNQ